MSTENTWYKINCMSHKIPLKGPAKKDINYQEYIMACCNEYVSFYKKMWKQLINL